MLPYFCLGYPELTASGEFTQISTPHNLNEISYTTIHQGAEFYLPEELPNLKQISGLEILDPKVQKQFDELQSKIPPSQPE